MRTLLNFLSLGVLISFTSAIRLEPPPGQRCSGRNYNGRRCCTPEQPCGLGEGDCDGPLDGGGSDGHRGCRGNLVCGSNNCRKFGLYYHEKDDYCDVPSSIAARPPAGVSAGVPAWTGQCVVDGLARLLKSQFVSPTIKRSNTPKFCTATCSANGFKFAGVQNSHQCFCGNTAPPQSTFAAAGECSFPCPGDWRQNCGGFYRMNVYSTASSITARPPPPTQKPSPVGVPLEPQPGQRCAGRNYNGRRCCTPQYPCAEGEGDCDGEDDGGQHDGNRGCQGDLVCGSNNCKKFGLYYHEKDDCCEKPSYLGTGTGTGINVQSHWSQWGAWSSCDRNCGIGKKSRVRYCNGDQCDHSQENQERVCRIREC